MPVRADNGDYVDQVSAVKAWAQAAHEVLVATAARPRGAIDQATLARLVQQRSGIATKQPASKWIAPLLGVIARHCNEKGEPLLPALVVRRDGTVGPIWDEVLRFARMAPPAEGREAHAAAQRAACQQKWAGAVVANSPAPSGPTKVVGATKATKAAEAKAQATRRTAKKEPLQGNACPRCFMQMSLTGVCDNCD